MPYFYWVIFLLLLGGCNKDTGTKGTPPVIQNNAPEDLRFYAPLENASFPVEIVPYVPEDAAIGYKVTRLFTVDKDEEDTHVYSLASGGDNAAFSIKGDILVTHIPFDYEEKALYKIKLRTTDREGLFFEKELDIAISNVNEAPTKLSLSSDEILENKIGGSLVADIYTQDPDVTSTHSYALIDGRGESVDNNFFTIDGTTLRSKVTTVFDEERKNSYKVRIRSQDQGGLFLDSTFIIKILDAGTPPEGISLDADSILEGSPVGTQVGKLETKDADKGDKHIYELVQGREDNADFEVDVQGRLKSKKSFSYQEKNTYKIYVRTTDLKENTFETTIPIRIISRGVNPTGIYLHPKTIAERKSSGTMVGLLSTQDDDDVRDAHTYTLLSHEDLFEVRRDTLVTRKLLFYAHQQYYMLDIRTTDLKGNSYEKEIKVSVLDIPDDPISISLDPQEIEEGKPVGTEVGVFSTTDFDQGDTHKYTLVNGEGAVDNSKFEIANRVLDHAFVLKSKQQFSLSGKNPLSIRVRTETQSVTKEEKPFEAVIQIKIIPPNQAPTDITLGSDAIVESKPVGTSIGILSTIDNDAMDTHTYSLVRGSGADDNHHFSIDGNQLKSNSVFSYAVKSSYQVRIRVQDGRGGAYEKRFAIYVRPTTPNLSPTDIHLSQAVFVLPAYKGDIFATISASDPNFDDTFTYTLVPIIPDDISNPHSISGADYLDNPFQIRDDKLIIANPSAAVDSIKIKVVDREGASFEKVFQIETRSYQPFITLWKTDYNGESVTIPTDESGLFTYDYDVAWGDHHDEGNRRNMTGSISYEYLLSGYYTVSIYGDFPSIYFKKDSRYDNALKLVQILSWGEISWHTMRSAFEGCQNLEKLPSNAPNLSRVTDLSRMFAGAVALDADISHWDVSAVTDMTSMFERVKLSTTNYDKLLIAWSQLSSLQRDVVFDAGNSQYSAKSEAARKVLTSTYGWKITDGGKE